MQPVSGDRWVRVSGTAAGTTVICANPSVLRTVVMGNNKTGTASLYDSATAAGTSATNFMQDIVNTSGTVPQSLTFNSNLRYGLVVVTGGTTDMLVMVD